MITTQDFLKALAPDLAPGALEHFERRFNRGGPHGHTIGTMANFLLTHPDAKSYLKPGVTFAADGETPLSAILRHLPLVPGAAARLAVDWHHATSAAAWNPAYLAECIVRKLDHLPENRGYLVNQEIPLRPFEAEIRDALSPYRDKIRPEAAETVLDQCLRTHSPGKNPHLTVRHVMGSTIGARFTIDGERVVLPPAAAAASTGSDDRQNSL